MSESGFASCSTAVPTHLGLAPSSCHQPGNLPCTRTAPFETPGFATSPSFNPHRLSPV
jgi:hypothetical protein